MRNLFSSVLFFCLSTGYAFAGINAANGFYLGGELGVAGWQPATGSSFSSSITPFTVFLRPFVGYRFNDYVGLESGFYDLANDDNSANYSGNLGADSYRLYVIDLAGKFIHSFSNGISVFGKVGLAYTHQSVFNQTFTYSDPSVDSSVNRILPEVGVGLSYNFTQNFATELSYTHLQGVDPIGRIEIIGLGLFYTFG